MQNLKLFLVFILLFLTQNVFSASISFNPAVPSVNQGDLVTVDVMMNDLQAPVATELGAFALTVGFDQSILAFESLVYSGFLGDTLDPFETSITTGVNVGSINLDNFSFLFDFELEALQGPSFVLASLTFSALNIGSSALIFSGLEFSDGFFADITADVSATTGVVNVSAVPVPGALMLLISGFLTFVLSRKKVTSH